MKIVVAPNAFKGCMDAAQAAAAISRGIRRIAEGIVVECVPVADGGDGLVSIATNSLHGEKVSVEVVGPLFQEVQADICLVRRSATAVVEMAEASGLVLVPDEFRNPENTTTYGTGQLLLKCCDLNVERIVVGLGGSATCDGGIGAAAAVGYRFLDRDGEELLPVGGNLSKIASIDRENVDPRFDAIQIDAACDVSNPLTGREGASHVYSPQKGADQKQVERLDQGLSNLAAIIKKDMGLEIDHLRGAGAAGGLGGGLVAFFHADLKRGIDLVMDIIGLKDKLQNADLVITGEGQIDYQTQFDKAPAGIAKMAKEYRIPCIALCGAIGEKREDLYPIGLDAVFSLCSGPLSLDRAIRDGENLLADAAEQAVRLFLAGRKTK